MLAPRPRHRHATRLLALAMALTLVHALPTSAAPADSQTSPAPALGSDPPKAEAIADGDANVSTQTGAFSYTYPITAPSGRLDMAPSLSLSYSSQGAIYGGLAAGWSLSVPEIKVDTGCGASQYPVVSIEEADPPPPELTCFVSTLAGGRELVKVTEPASADVLLSYRAQGDASFARYQRLLPGPGGETGGWRVLETSGTIHYFEGPTESRMPLTRSIDAFGNEVEYRWTFHTDLDGKGGNEYLLGGIDYTSNKGQNVRAHARVTLTWSPVTTCGDTPIGAQSSYHYKERWIDGARRLTRITAEAIDPATPAQTVQHTRQIDLAYDASTEVCSSAALFSPYRQLVSITERAWGANVAAQPLVILPAVTFDYGSANIVRNGAPTTITGMTALAEGSRRPWKSQNWAPQDQMLLDFDGDGLQDLLRAVVVGTPSAPTSQHCGFTWRRNQGGTGFGAESTPIYLPRLPWQGQSATKLTTEVCALNFQRTELDNYDHPGDPCTQWFGTIGNVGVGSPRTTYAPTIGTYLNYKWMDIDSDGLTDLVAAIHFDPAHFDETGTVFNFGTCAPAPTGGDCPIFDDACMTGLIACDETPAVCGISAAQYQACYEAAPRIPCHRAMARDTSPVGRPPRELGDVVIDPEGWVPGCGTFEHEPLQVCGGRYPWMVYRNVGGQLSGLPSATSLTNNGAQGNPDILHQPIPLESEDGDASTFGPGVGGFSSGWHVVQDVDGDGHLDAALIAPGAGVESNPAMAHSTLSVFRGNGKGGFLRWPDGSYRMFPMATWKGLPPSKSAANPSNGSTAPRWYRTFGEIQLMDLNGDGLAEHLHNRFSTTSTVWGAMFGTPAGHVVPNSTTPQLALPLSGYGFTASVTRAPTTDTTPFSFPPVEPIVPFQPQSVNLPDYTLAEGTRYATTRLLDLDHDGRVDRVVLADASGNPDENATPMVFWNVGGTWMAPGSGHAVVSGDPTLLSDTRRAIRNEVVLTPDPAPVNPRPTWQTRSDVIDLDGDGVTELVYFNGTSTVQRRHAVGGTPPRLMWRVRNGRGATTTVTYASMTDATVVTQGNTLQPPLPSPTSDIGVDRRRHMPRAGWVVAQLTEHDAFEASTVSTQYRYHDPVYGPDQGEVADHGFRGFMKTRAIGPRGSVTVDEFDYSATRTGSGVGAGTFVAPLDPTGLKVTTTVYAAENQVVAAGTAGAPGVDARATSITRMQYQKVSLFSNKVWVVLPLWTAALTCATGISDTGVVLAQTQSQCLATPASAVTTHSAVSGKASDNQPGPILAVVTDTTRVIDGGPSAPFDGNDRQTQTFTYLYTNDAASPPAYRLRTIGSESTIGPGGPVFAKSEATWDAAFKYVTEQKAYFDAATTATTQYVVNGIGVVTSRKKPRQVETLGAVDELHLRPELALRRRRDQRARARVHDGYRAGYRRGDPEARHQSVAVRGEQQLPARRTDPRRRAHQGRRPGPPARAVGRVLEQRELRRHQDQDLELRRAGVWHLELHHAGPGDRAPAHPVERDAVQRDPHAARWPRPAHQLDGGGRLARRGDQLRLRHRWQAHQGDAARPVEAGGDGWDGGLRVHVRLARPRHRHASAGQHDAERAQRRRRRVRAQHRVSHRRGRLRRGRGRPHPAGQRRLRPVGRGQRANQRRSWRRRGCDQRR